MENQNMTTEAKIAEINNMILRRIDALKELLKMQNKVMSFLVEEGIDGSAEGEAIAKTMGDMIKVFGDVLPDSIYNKVIEGEI